MTATAVSEKAAGGEALIAPGRSSEKDFKLEKPGLHATGLAITIFSFSLISIITEATATSLLLQNMKS